MTHSRRPGAVAALLAAGLVAQGLAPSLHATTLKRMDMAELAARADRIVHARAVDQTVYWDPTGTQIHTDTLFEVLDEAKGAGPRQLTVSMFGGALGVVEMKEAGTPSFTTGAEYVLFTSPRPDGKKNLVGFSQGHMRVLTDADGVKQAESVVPTGVTYMEQGPRGLRIARPHKGRAPLADLMAQIRRQIAHGEPAGPSLTKTPQPVSTTGQVTKEKQP